MLTSISSRDFFRLTRSPTSSLAQGLEGSSKHSSSYSMPYPGVSEQSTQPPAQSRRCSAGKIGTAQRTLPLYISLGHRLWMIQHGGPAVIFLHISKSLIFLIANAKLDPNLSTQPLICVQFFLS